MENRLKKSNRWIIFYINNNKWCFDQYQINFIDINLYKLFKDHFQIEKRNS
jgi:hypothetical protein